MEVCCRIFVCIAVRLRMAHTNLHLMLAAAFRATGLLRHALEIESSMGLLPPVRSLVADWRGTAFMPDTQIYVALPRWVLFARRAGLATPGRYGIVRSIEITPATFR